MHNRKDAACSRQKKQIRCPAGTAHSVETAEEVSSEVSERVLDETSGKSSNKTSSMGTVDRRRGVAIMVRLIGLVRPLWFVIILAVLFGSVGYLCAIALTILAAGTLFGMTPLSVLAPLLLILAVLRGVLHYAEQYCNHFIAFKLLAIIRHQVFAALRRLCPAKLEGKDRGNLISIITSDIELLEVFYAHTISPIAIAVVTEAVMIGFLSFFHPLAALLAFAAYMSVGCALPLWNGKRTGGAGTDHWDSWSQRLRQIHSVEIIDAVLGCGQRFGAYFRAGDMYNSYRPSAGGRIVCDTGDPSVP